MIIFDLKHQNQQQEKSIQIHQTWKNSNHNQSVNENNAQKSSKTIKADKKEGTQWLFLWEC